MKGAGANRMRDYYRDNPLMVSSPFGGVDGINGELIAEVFARLGICVDGKRVLDVGCGRGFAGEWVRDQGGDYVGADMVVTPSPVSVSRVQADAAHLPFASETFDALLCIDAFEHMPDMHTVAREFRRVLKPEGFIFLSVPNYGNVAGIVKRYCERFGGYEKNTWAPFRNWQPQELEQPLTNAMVRRVFREAGFNTMRPIGHAPEALLGLFPWAQHPHMPERVLYRLQRVALAAGPAIVKAWPGTSMHAFWKIDRA